MIRKGVLLNHAATLPPPSKDYAQIYVTLEHVIYRRWKITLRSGSAISPVEIKDTHEEFLDDSRCQTEVLISFGEDMLEYVKRLAGGRIDYLLRLQKDMLIKVLEYLELEDIQNLMRVCHPLRDICGSDELWEQLYKINTHGDVTEDLETLAEAIGWRKLFFTNKLQLQLMLKRLPANQPNDMTVDDIEDMSTVRSHVNTPAQFLAEEAAEEAAAAEAAGAEKEHVFLTADSRASSAALQQQEHEEQ